MLKHVARFAFDVEAVRGRRANGERIDEGRLIAMWADTIRLVRCAMCDRIRNLTHAFYFGKVIGHCSLSHWSLVNYNLSNGIPRPHC